MLRIYLFFIFLFCCLDIYAQEKENLWFGPNDQETLSKMGLNISIPDNLFFDPNFECFDNNPKLFKAFTCLLNKLVSQNGESIVFIPITNLITEQDSILITKLSGTPFNQNEIHTNNLRQQITTLTNYNATDWNKALSYLEQSEAKEKFNADSVVYFQTKLEGDMIYDGRLNNLTSLMLQKKGRGFINIVVFHSDRSDLTIHGLIEAWARKVYYYNQENNK